MRTGLSTEKPIGAFILSLIGGLVILGGSGLMISFTSAPSVQYYGGTMGGYYGMISGYYGTRGDSDMAQDSMVMLR